MSINYFFEQKIVKVGKKRSFTLQNLGNGITNSMILRKFALYTCCFLDFIFYNPIFMFCDFFSCRGKYYFNIFKSLPNLKKIKRKKESLWKGKHQRICYYNSVMTILSSQLYHCKCIINQKTNFVGFFHSNIFL